MSTPRAAAQFLVSARTFVPPAATGAGTAQRAIPTIALKTYGRGGAGCTGVELRRRHNMSDDFLNFNLTRNLNLPKDFGGKSKSRSKIKSKITIKNFAKCLNSMAVGSGCLEPVEVAFDQCLQGIRPFHLCPVCLRK